jgi:chemotaxis protein methyltransferase CheR
MPEPQRLSATLLAEVSEFIAAEMGLSLPPARWPELEHALGEAARHFPCADAEACARRLLSSTLTRPEVEFLARHLTVGETYFFRQAQVFELLEHQVLPALLQARRHGDKRLRVWSAGCASGEEIYSLAMLLDRLLPDYDAWNITLLATDINPAALEKAAKGLYREWSFRNTPPYIRQRYFRKVSEGLYEIDARLRARVTFGYLNLSQDNYPSVLSNTNALDVIFCRNVLMYFTPERAQQVMQRLFRCLLSGAWLAVSQTEVSHLHSAPFEQVTFAGAILHRKPALRETPERAALSQPSPPVPAPPVFQPVLPAEPPPPLSEDVPAPAPVLEAAQAAQRARGCANQGNLAEAAWWCEQAVAADKLNAGYHYLSAIIAQERGFLVGAQQALRRALFLAPDFALAHYALGNLARRQGAAADAARHYANALEMLRRYPAQ